jgi:succinoglycan biosynthesis transport protein ExoP
VVNSQRPRPPADQATPAVSEEGYVATQVAILQSDLILKRIVDDLHLTEDPDFALKPRLLSRLPGVLGAQPESDGLPLQDLPFLRERTAVERLRRALAIRRVGTTYVVDVSVTTSEPAKSARIANAIVARFAEDQRLYAVRITERQSADSGVRIVSEATRPLQKSGPNAILIIAASLVGGLAAGLVLAFLRDVLRRGLKTCRAVEDQTGLDCLGLVPEVASARRGWWKGRRRGGQPSGKASARTMAQYVVDHPDSAYADCIRYILSIIEERLAASGSLAIGFASPATGAGQSSLAASCAALAAVSGRKTLFIDADVGTVGLSRLHGAAPSEDLRALVGALVLPREGMRAFDILKAGLTSATATPEWLNAVRDDTDGYELIFVDLPPITAAGTIRTLSAPLDGVVVVAQWGKTTADHVALVLRAIKDSERKIVGVALNRAGG